MDAKRAVEDLVLAPTPKTIKKTQRILDEDLLKTYDQRIQETEGLLSDLCLFEFQFMPLILANFLLVASRLSRANRNKTVTQELFDVSMEQQR